MSALDDFTTAHDDACVKTRFDGNNGAYREAVGKLSQRENVSPSFVMQAAIDPDKCHPTLPVARVLVQLWQLNAEGTEEFLGLLKAAGCVPADTTPEALQPTPRPLAAPRRAPRINPKETGRIDAVIIEGLVKAARDAYAAMLKEKKYDYAKATDISTALFRGMMNYYKDTHPNLPLLAETASGGAVESRATERWLGTESVDPNYLAIARKNKADGAAALKTPAGIAITNTLIADAELAKEAANYLAGIPWKGRKDAHEMIAMLADIDFKVEDFMRLARFQQHQTTRDYSEKSLGVPDHTLNNIVTARTNPHAIPKDKSLHIVAENLCGTPPEDAKPLDEEEKAAFRRLVYGAERDAGEKLVALVRDTDTQTLSGLARTRFFNDVFRLTMQRDGLRDRFVLRDAVVKHNRLGTKAGTQVYSALNTISGPYEMPEKLQENPNYYEKHHFRDYIGPALAKNFAAYVFRGEAGDMPELRGKLETALHTPPRAPSRADTAYETRIEEAPAEGQTPP